MITSTLLLLVFLDHPYASGVGGLRPVAMERALAQLRQEQAFAHDKVIVPCDARGADNHPPGEGEATPLSRPGPPA